MNSLSHHPSDEELLSLSDHQIEGEAATALEQHLAGCALCREKVQEFRRDIEALTGTWIKDLKASLPPPPQPWADIRPKFGNGRSPIPIRRPQISRVRGWMAAVAAAILLCVIVMRFTNEETVSAAELLDRASRTEPETVKPSARIRVKTKRGTYVRPAVAASGDRTMTDLQASFTEAGFSWEEPLSARSFARWRNSLPEKDDRVTMQSSTEGRLYQIRTATSQGNLAVATLTLRKSDLKPILERLEFRNEEWVEISEMEPGATTDSGTPAVASPQYDEPVISGTREIGPSQELQVIAALHRIGADLGEDIKVERGTTSVAVTGLAVSPSRQEKIRQALSSLPYVELMFEAPQPVARTKEAQPARVSSNAEDSLARFLREKWGNGANIESAMDDMRDASEAALDRAHALKALADRFPAGTSLSEEDRRTLESIGNTHASALHKQVAQLRELLAPLTGTVPRTETSGVEAWQPAAADLLRAALEVDRTISRALAGQSETAPAALFAEVARPLGQLSQISDSLVASLQ